MLKYIKSFYYEIRPLPLILLAVTLGTWFYMSYTAPIDVHRTYKGIKFQNGNPEISKPITIQIDGKYKKGLFGEADEFAGSVKIDVTVLTFSDLPMKFNSYGMAPMCSGTFNGIIFINDMFEKLTIQSFQTKQQGEWWLSAPCNSREDAVDISNAFVQKLSKAWTIR